MDWKIPTPVGGIRMPMLTCAKCRASWRPRICRLPVTCPRCHQPSWWIPRTRFDRDETPSNTDELPKPVGAERNRIVAALVAMRENADKVFAVNQDRDERIVHSGEARRMADGVEISGDLPVKDWILASMLAARYATEIENGRGA